MTLSLFWLLCADESQFLIHSEEMVVFILWKPTRDIDIQNLYSRWKRMMFKNHLGSFNKVYVRAIGLLIAIPTT